MATRTVANVITRVQDLLDDPAGRRFKPDYIRPKVDAANEEFAVTLESLGVQQQEMITAFNIPAAVSAPLDLTAYFSNGQPLQYFFAPEFVEWKLQGQPDVEYAMADRVDKLDDVDLGNVGCQQYCWTGGTLLLTPSYTPVTLRITFWGLGTSIVDSAQNVMRGIGHILALDVAITICAMNNQMGKLGAELTTRRRKAKISLKNLLVQGQQKELIVPRGTRGGGTAVQISAGGKPYS